MADVNSKRAPNFLDLTGRRFGRGIVLELHSITNDKKARWRCRCDCGNYYFPIGKSLTTGHTSSCGCLSSETTARRNATSGALDGASKLAAYNVWRAMLHRCTNPADNYYADYGGRGITVCQRWMDYRSFLADMGDRPPGLSIDRIDNNAGYSPENCRWTTMAQQQRNRRSTRLITHDGRTQAMTDWAAEYGLRFDTLRRRLARGDSIERALRPVE